MAAPEPDPHAEDVRRFALGTYVPPIVAFAVIVAALLFYWRDSPRDDARLRGGDTRAEGTSGTEGERGRADATPGGHNPDPKPSSPEDEVKFRGGRVITEVRDVLANGSRDAIGQRVELKDIRVERVDSATLFWIRDGEHRIAVSIPQGGPTPQAGSSVNVTGTVERAGDRVRIRASQVGENR